MKKFIQGILFISLVIPVLENIVLFCNQVTEFFCTKIAVKTFKLKSELAEDGESEVSTAAIGFHYTPNDEEEEYFEEEE